MEAEVVDAVADLQRQKRAIDAALAVNRQELKKARWRQKDARRAEESIWRLNAFVSDVALIIYVLTGYFLEPAIRFLRSVGQKRRWPQKSEDELGLLVEQVFSAVDPDDIAALTDTAAPSKPAALRAAMKWVQEWGLVAWTRRLNEDKGVAPSTQAVLEKAEEIRPGLPEAARPAAQGTSAEARSRMWLRRWRSRWGGKLARIRLREDLSKQDMAEKAPEKLSIWGKSLGAETAPRNRYRNEVHKRWRWGAFCIDFKRKSFTCARILVANLVPKNGSYLGAVF